MPTSNNNKKAIPARCSPQWKISILLPLLANPIFAAELNQVVVTATRTAQPSFALPMAIDSISADAIHTNQLQVNLSETLAQTPGVIAHNRQNYAQDLQISIRGFGARSTFGVRGIRLYVDGIPATMPDGQGQLSHIDLTSAQRIEVLRGPFSALYGNASGGVISVFTQSGQPGTQAQLNLLTGSYDTQRESAFVSGAQDGFDYVASASNFSTDGYRDHSAVRRSNANFKLDFDLDEQSQLKIIANAVDMPEAQDPLGLTRAQLDDDPTQAGANAELFNTRKSVRQQQLGADYLRTLSDSDTLNAMMYGGQRSTVQYQSTPACVPSAPLPCAQKAPTSAGGVIDLERTYSGADTHWAHTDSLFGKALQITGGFAFDNLNEARQGYLNYSGSTVGVKGDLRRDESNRVYDFDQYLQAQYQLGQNWLLEAGVRHSKVEVDSNDHYIVPNNGDDSGAKDFSATTPTLGITWSASDAVNFYAAYGKGFETPTLNELSYKSTSGTNTGLNFALDPSRSEHYEIGAKVLLDANSRIDFALFHALTHDELAVAANSSGRSVYQNVGKTQRDGVEWQYAGQWDNGIGLKLAYTLLRAKYADDFASCPGAPCSTPLTIDAGNRIPGVPVNALFGELSWREQRSGFNTALAAHSESKLYVNDTNSDATDGYTTLDWNAGFTQKVQRWQLTEFVRIDNLTDRYYAGSVIVNESNARYFESAPRRNSYLGISATAQF
jgi:iron complex outermembrane receptor protein